MAAKDAQALLDVLAPDVDFRGLTPNRAWEAGDAEALVEIILAAEQYAEAEQDATAADVLLEMPTVGETSSTSSGT